jgi:hypothetical protein
LGNVETVSLLAGSQLFKIREGKEEFKSSYRERDGIGIIDGLPSQPSTNDLLMVVG